MLQFFLISILSFKGIYECPGGTILRAAHLDIETFTMDRVSCERREFIKWMQSKNHAELYERWRVSVFLFFCMEGIAQNQADVGRQVFRAGLLWILVQSWRGLCAFLFGQESRQRGGKSDAGSFQRKCMFSQFCYSFRETLWVPEIVSWTLYKLR